MERSDIELQRLVRLFVQSSYSEDIEAFFFVAKGVLGLDRGEVRERLQRIFEANDQALPQAGRPENDEN